MLTYDFNTDDSGLDEPIVVQSPGGATAVHIFQNGKTASSGFKLRVPLSTSRPVTYAPGDDEWIKAEDHPGKPRFANGEIIGYVSAVSGTINMAQIEF